MAVALVARQAAGLMSAAMKRQRGPDMNGMVAKITVKTASTKKTVLTAGATRQGGLLLVWGSDRDRGRTTYDEYYDQPTCNT